MPDARAGTMLVLLANARQTSRGYHQPGDLAELGWDEAQDLIRSGHAAAVGTVAADRLEAMVLP